MAAQYPNSLASDVWEGLVGNVAIKWGSNQQTRAINEAATEGVELSTVKAMTEHFLYNLAVRLGHTKISVF